MGGCCVVVLMMMLVPILIIGLVIFLGIVGGALATALLSGVLLIIGTRSGLFQRFLESEVAWQRITAKIVRFILIVAIVLSILALVVAGIVVYQFTIVK